MFSRLKNGTFGGHIIFDLDEKAKIVKNMLDRGNQFFEQYNRNFSIVKVTCLYLCSLVTSLSFQKSKTQADIFAIRFNFVKKILLVEFRTAATAVRVEHYCTVPFVLAFTGHKLRFVNTCDPHLHVIQKQGKAPKRDLKICLKMIPARDRTGRFCFGADDVYDQLFTLLQ